MVFLGAGTDMSAIHGPIADTDISKFFKSCFLLCHRKYNVLHAFLFFKNFKNQNL